jgi:hypothetical protein
MEKDEWMSLRRGLEVAEDEGVVVEEEVVEERVRGLVLTLSGRLVAGLEVELIEVELVTSWSAG